MIDPRRRTVTVHRPDGSSRACEAEGSLHLGDVLPGFAPAVEDLFA